MRTFLKAGSIVMTALPFTPVTAQKNKIRPSETVTKSVAAADTILYHMTTYAYKKVDTAQLQLDVYSPETADTQPSPASILFHGVQGGALWRLRQVTGSLARTQVL